MLVRCSFFSSNFPEVSGCLLFIQNCLPQVLIPFSSFLNLEKLERKIIVRMAEILLDI